MLVFGAGSSMPSGAPSANELKASLAQKFNIANPDTLTLPDLCAVIERRFDRRDLIVFLRQRLEKLVPSGGLINMPRFRWSGIFTTNYDMLIERVYEKQQVPLEVFSSNYDFHSQGFEEKSALYKLHGTIEKDTAFGDRSRIIITGSDYDLTQEYREILYTKFRDQLSRCSAVIIGHSLNDPDLREVIDEALRLKKSSGAPGKIYLLIFQRNEDLALVFETRGFEVCFGGIDEFFAELAKNEAPTQLVMELTNDVTSAAPAVNPSSLDVSAAMANEAGQLERMYNGRPASYGDIARGWTFNREISDRIEAQIADPNGRRLAYILGAAGVGKTTAARKVLFSLVARKFHCWEHKDDFVLPADAWIRVDRELRRRKEMGVLLIDSAHNHLREINHIVETIGREPTKALSLVLISSRPHWNPRLKSPSIFANGAGHEITRLSDAEIISLLDLLDANAEIRNLVEPGFIGFNRPQRLERLQQRCSNDMFVCLRNIFAMQGIDNIILQEFNSLPENYQGVYLQVAAMEAAGVRVHRELVD